VREETTNLAEKRHMIERKRIREELMASKKLEISLMSESAERSRLRMEEMKLVVSTLERKMEERESEHKSFISLTLKETKEEREKVVSELEERLRKQTEMAREETREKMEEEHKLRERQQLESLEATKRELENISVNEVASVELRERGTSNLLFLLLFLNDVSLVKCDVQYLLTALRN
jgi:hypothetical protein